MSSLLTNSSAMVALTTLRNINTDLADTQSRISTGMRVADASDNAAYWSIATTMRSDNEALGAVQDALGLGAATVDVAFTAMDQAEGVATQIKAKLLAATKDGVDRGQIQADITALQDQLSTIAASASFNGENWLSQDTSVADYSSDKSFVGTFTRTADNEPELQNIDIDILEMILVDGDTDAATNKGLLTADLSAELNAAILAAGGTALTDYTLVGGDATSVDFLKIDISDLEDGNTEHQIILRALGNAVDGVLKDMTDAAAELGSTKGRVDMQMEFVKNLTDAVDRGIGQLVDADMNAESTRLQALQTQQQLGIQALSIANSGSQNILSLFR
ncbi:Flagellin [Pseudovibrio sp. W64]|uniref:flagellin N-terminal helical domain-containing protein n=1 Tax=Pseudovibrio sp. W64 TaxID=1735583 RepID=UPI0007AEBD1B|nr:flagellin [Pseudovibrio sp. W64]KZK81883.1 Flagellin [Pseudovibrio sp. W64]